MFRNRWRTQFGGNPTRSPLYREVSTGIAFAGIEYYLPLFFETTQTLFDYLPPTAVIMTLSDKTHMLAEKFWQEINERYAQLHHDIERPILPPTSLFLQANQVFAQLRHYPHVHLNHEPTEHVGGINFATLPPPVFSIVGIAAVTGKIYLAIPDSCLVDNEWKAVSDIISISLEPLPFNSIMFPANEPIWS